METPRETNEKGPPWWRSIRYRIAMIGFLGGANVILQRSNLSIAIVCMVNHTALEILRLKEESLVFNSSIIINDSYSYPYANHNISYNDAESHQGTGTCNNPSTASVQREDGEFVWSKSTQGLLLGALFWGYIPFQIIGGYYIKKLGIRHAIGPFYISISILTLLSHPAALWSPWALFVLRVLIGVTNSICIPGNFFILSLWAPPAEKGRIGSLLFAGITFGNVIAFPISGLLCKYGFAGGWPSVFYVSGIFSFLICILWYSFVYDSPLKHPSISESEKAYISSKMDFTALTRKKEPVPWCRALTSLPVISIFIAHTTLNWGLYLMLTSLPLYMREVLKFEAASNGFISMLPFMCLTTQIVISGIIFDNVTKRCGLKISRKSSAIVGLIGPAILLTTLSFFDCEQSTFVIVLMCLAVAFLSFNFVGIMVNMYDISPTHGGQIMTVSNTVANLPGILTPYTVSQLTPDNSREQWQKVFFVTSGILVFGALTFVVFGKVTVQKWSESGKGKEEVIGLNSGVENFEVIGQPLMATNGGDIGQNHVVKNDEDIGQNHVVQSGDH